jgi:hypothetical protein
MYEWSALYVLSWAVQSRTGLCGGGFVDLKFCLWLQEVQTGNLLAFKILQATKMQYSISAVRVDCGYL